MKFSYNNYRELYAKKGIYLRKHKFYNIKNYEVMIFNNDKFPEKLFYGNLKECINFIENNLINNGVDYLKK